MSEKEITELQHAITLVQTTAEKINSDLAYSNFTDVMNYLGGYADGYAAALSRD